MSIRETDTPDNADAHYQQRRADGAACREAGTRPANHVRVGHDNDNWNAIAATAGSDRYQQLALAVRV
jgi:hypothetical protein